ncbi:Dinitrogenase iron-molybdenum cofactor biosynthesis protein [Dehalogenimonas lykanthroporepellens BL-DC-9]|nr:Dinitrogenase iron-molybdenum cofactor biosynthesis protein [Dehalogenimonas lykanthroporepellens BL-DC-9]
MKIAITAGSPNLDSNVDPRFGRCRYLILLNPETMDHEAIENSSAEAPGGAGIAAAQLVAGKGAQVLLTGNCGPKAYRALSAAGIKVMTGVSGSINDAIKSYKKGELTESTQANVAEHFGTGSGGGFRRGTEIK